MAEQTYTTRYLQGVLRSLIRPNTFLTRRYFPKMVLSEAEEISFDVEDADEKLAPFVSPVVAGAVMQELGFKTTTIKPAYIKIKTPLAPMKTIKRAIGESFGVGEMTRAQRQQLRVATTLARHQDRIARRKEWMASEILVKGSVTIEGDGYPKTDINFGRSNNLGIQLTLGDRWSQGTSDPIRDLENWAQEVFVTSGAVVSEIVMDPKAWAAFRANEKVLKLLDVRRADGAGPLNIGPQQPVAEGAVFVGSLNAFQIFVYAASYIAENGARTPYLPAGTVLGMTSAFDGTQYHGAIEDEEAGIKPYETFTKSWLENDPSVRFLLSQTAPILAPGRKDGAFAANVL